MSARTNIVLVLGMLGHKDHEFQASVCYKTRPCNKNQKEGDGEMGQHLRVLAAFREDLNWISSIHKVAHNQPPVNLVPGDSMTSSGLYRH